MSGGGIQVRSECLGPFSRECQNNPQARPLESQFLEATNPQPTESLYQLKCIELRSLPIFSWFWYTDSSHRWLPPHRTAVLRALAVPCELSQVNQEVHWGCRHSHN